MTRSKLGPIRAAVLLPLVALMATAELAHAQSARARLQVPEENFRREANNGKVLATVFQGAEFPVVGRSGNWLEVELRGWIWAPSVAATDRGGFDLVVTADGGENLRAEPQGRILARLLEGFLLDRVGSRGNWVEVRRRGWLWRPSLSISEAGSPAASADRSAEPGAPTRTEPEEPSVLTPPAELAVLTRPDGDTVAVLRPGGQTQVLGRTGDWLRVRLDGWVYGPSARDSAVDLADTGDLTPAMLRSEPARYRGALVRWRVQFISLRRAEPVRSDFEEGEPFVQARAAGDAGFVYLAVPDELMELANDLRPLQYVTVVGRVRTGRSSLTGSPIVELTDIEAEPPTP